MKKKIKETPFIMVIWDDSCEPGDDGPHDLDYFDHPNRRSVPTISSGIVLKDDETGVVLCRDILVQEDGEESNRELSIKREFIIAKKYLG